MKKRKKIYLSEKEHDVLWERIAESIHEQKLKTYYWRKWAVAATILLILGVGGLYFYRFTPGIDTIDYTSIDRVEPESDNIVLVLSDEQHKSFSSNNIEIEYDKEGNISVDDNKVVIDKLNQDKEIQ